MCDEVEDLMDYPTFVLKDGRTVTMREYGEIIKQRDRLKAEAEAKAKADADKKPAKRKS